MRRHRRLGRQELGYVLRRSRRNPGASPRSRCVAAGPAAVQEADLVARRSQLRATAGVPPGVRAEAVDGHDAAPRLTPLRARGGAVLGPRAKSVAVGRVTNSYSRQSGLSRRVACSGDPLRVDRHPQPGAAQHGGQTAAAEGHVLARSAQSQHQPAVVGAFQVADALHARGEVPARPPRGCRSRRPGSRAGSRGRWPSRRPPAAGF